MPEQTALTGITADNTPPGGRAVLAFYCSRCHALPDAGLHSAVEWPAIVARMLDKMHRGDHAMPDQQQIALMLDYLQANSTRE